MYKKNISISILFYFLFITIINPEEVKILTKDLLIKNEWNSNGYLFNYGGVIQFNLKGDYKAYLAAEGGGDCSSSSEGSYRIEGGTLFLYFKDNCSKNNDPKSLKCIINSNSKDPFFHSFLDCGEAKYYGAFKRKAGEQINFFGTEAIIIDPKIVKSKTNIKVRQAPSTTAKYYDCNIKDSSTVPYLPKDRKLEIRARTVQKDTINGIENYWYLAREDFDWYESCIITNRTHNMVWVFGEYIN